MRSRDLIRREREAVRRFVDRVAVAYGAQTAVEGPVDGADDDRGSLTLLLAKRGVGVTVALRQPEDATRLREIYSNAGVALPPVLPLDTSDIARLPSADLVASFDAPPWVPDWERYLASITALARKVCVVVVRNPERVGARGLAHPGRETIALGAVLWAAGRVREHTYLLVPGIVVPRVTSLQHAAPGEVGAPVRSIVRRTALLHGFVVDTAPRTPQARRRLRTTQDTTGKTA